MEHLSKSAVVSAVAVAVVAVVPAVVGMGVVVVVVMVVTWVGLVVFGMAAANWIPGRGLDGVEGQAAGGGRGAPGV